MGTGACQGRVCVLPIRVSHAILFFLSLHPIEQFHSRSKFTELPPDFPKIAFLMYALKMLRYACTSEICYALLDSLTEPREFFFFVCAR